MTGEQKAAAVGSLPISSAFQGIPTYANQEKVTSAVTDMIIDLNLSGQYCGQTEFQESFSNCILW